MLLRSELMKKCGLIGSCIGLALFVAFGILQGSLLGGTAGLLMVTHLFGANTIEVMGNSVLLRTVVAASMLTGVIVSFVMFVAAGVAAGAAWGFALSLFARKAEA